MANESTYRVLLIVLSTLSLIAGVYSLFYAIRYNYASRRVDSALYVESTDAGNLRLQGKMAIAIYSVELLTALLGLVGALLKHRLILFVFAVLVVLDMIVLIFMIVVMSVACAGVNAASSDAMKKAFPHYGSDTENEHQDFTKQIDKFMTDHRCCGWSSDANENLFVTSAWYQKQGAQADKLPTYCCKSANVNCTKVESMSAARAQGLVHSKSCLEIFTKLVLFQLYFYLGSFVLVLLLDVIVLYAARVLIKDAGAARHNSPGLR